MFYEVRVSPNGDIIGIDLEPKQFPEQFIGTAVGINEKTGETLYFALLCCEAGYFWVQWYRARLMWVRPKGEPYCENSESAVAMLRRAYPCVAFIFCVDSLNMDGTADWSPERVTSAIEAEWASCFGHRN